MTTFFDETLGFFATKTTMHGVKNLVDSGNRPMRMMWAIVVISALSTAILNGFEVTYSYMIEGSSTTKLAFDVYADEGLPFPMITICPTRNPFLASRLKERNLSSNAAAFLLLMVDKAGSMAVWDQRLQGLRDQLHDELQRSLQDNETLLQLFNYLSPSCGEMVSGCYVSGVFKNSSTCCLEVFSENYAVYYQGRCISTRLSTLLLQKNQTQPGDYSGISIILQEDKDTFVAELDLRLSLAPIQEGNRVILNPWYQLPHDAISEQTYIANVGAVTRLGVTMTTIDTSGMFTGPWPWSRRNCVDLPRPWVEGEVVSDDCRMNQLRSWYTAAFNCTPLGMLDSAAAREVGEVGNATICQPKNMFQTSLNWTDGLAAERACPIKCREVSLEAIIDSTPFKQQVLEHSIVFGGAAEESPNRTLTFSIVTVYFPTLVSRQITLSRATFMEWLSAFGGQLSLFIGASVITMLEIAVFCVRVVVLAARRLVGALSPESSDEDGEGGKERELVRVGEGKKEMERNRVRSIAQVVPIST